MKKITRFSNFFISSTFRDMQNERDVLNNRILPELREYANKKAADIAMVDLRWGISTDELDSDVGMRKILSVCMSLIRDCIPHFIVLIGEKYGTIPSPQIFETVGDAFVGSSEWTDKSITELEIMQAISFWEQQNGHNNNFPLIIAMRNPIIGADINNPKCRDYLSTTPLEAQRMDALKKRLKEKYPDNIIYYDGAWDNEKNDLRLSENFAQQLIIRLKKHLDESLSDAPRTEEELKYFQDQHFSKDTLNYICGRKDESVRILAFAKEVADPESTKHTLILQGVSGSGKSTVMGHCARILSEDPSILTLSIFCGNGVIISDVMDLLRHLIWRLRQEINNTSDGEDEPFYTVEEGSKRLENLLMQVSTQKRVVIVIDALDRLHLDTTEPDLYFLPIVNNCKYIISVTDRWEIKSHVLTNRSRMILPFLPETEMEDMVRLHMNKISKELSGNTCKHLVKMLRYRSPLYLKLVLFRLKMLSAGDFVQINSGMGEAYFNQLLGALPDREEELGVEVLLHGGHLLQIPQIREALFICSSIPGGCRGEDIVRIMGNRITLLDLNIYLRYMDQLIIADSDGYICFAHHALERGILALRDAEGYSLSHICNYVAGLPNSDPVKLRAAFPLCYLTNRADIFATYLAEVFVEEESCAITSTSYRFLISNSLYNSIKKFFREHRSQNSISFIHKIIEEAALQSHSVLYGVFGALLFSYDKIVDEINEHSITQLMKIIHGHCMQSLYPIKNWRYLRLCYVCCEQCGHRSTDYNDKEYYYHLFYKLCCELHEMTGPDFPKAHVILHDMCMAFNALASLYQLRRFSYALQLYDQSIYYGAQCDYQRHLASEKNIFAALEAKMEKAKAIISKAQVNKQIGWAEEESITDLATGNSYSIKELMQEARETLELYEESITSDQKLLSLYISLCELYRYTGEIDLEYRAIWRMIRCAERCYEADGHYLSLDSVRNGWLRMAMIEDDSKPLIQRIDEGTKSLDILRQIKSMTKGRRGSESMGERITQVTLQKLFEWYCRCLEEREIKNAQDLVDCSNLCCQFMVSLDGDLASLMTNGGDRVYQKVQWFANYSNHCIEKLYNLALSEGKNLHLDTALILADLGHKLTLLHAEQFSSMEHQLSKLLGFCEILVLTYRNQRLLNQIDIVSEKEKEFAVKLRYYIFHICDSHARRFFLNRFHILSQYECFDTEAIAWTNYVGWCLAPVPLLFDDPKSRREKESTEALHQEMLLDVAKDYRHYGLPGQKTTYFRLLDNPLVSRETRNTIVAFFSKHYTESPWRGFLERSDLLEAITMEHFYNIGEREKAREILYYGYRDYMELPLMYLMRKYDRIEFESLYKNLNPICIATHRKCLQEMQSMPESLAELYREFIKA
ncbi:MAG: DUF4062 domain-containing protein [Oscillospiraceae bacterium]|nr:DUF4062 domain-containing protein [Oscillospiraceae bacterium]